MQALGELLLLGVAFSGMTSGKQKGWYSSSDLDGRLKLYLHSFGYVAAGLKRSELSSLLAGDE